MMSTRRSLFTLAAIGLMMVALAAPAAAQNARDTVAATVAPVATDAFTSGPTASTTTYDEMRVTWVIEADYKADCTVPAADAGDTACAADGNQTPLTGVTVYYSTKAFTTGKEAGVMMESATSSGAGATATMGYAVLEDLTPSAAGTTYFIRLAAMNAYATGDLTSAMLEHKTAPAPIPDRVRGVMVASGDEELTVSWTAPHPGGSDQTDVKLATYDLQYRESETATSVAGDWMPELPEKPMSVKGDLTKATIKDLENDVMYDVQVRALNTAGGKGTYSRQTGDTSGTPSADGTTTTTPTTPTPALPLVGILGLGAGLVAAGRRRLRRRQALLS